MGLFSPKSAMPFLITLKLMVIMPAISMAPQNEISPSPCEKCRSPTENLAPSTCTGRYTLLPRERFLMLGFANFGSYSVISQMRAFHLHVPTYRSGEEGKKRKERNILAVTAMLRPSRNRPGTFFPNPLCQCSITRTSMRTEWLRRQRHIAPF